MYLSSELATQAETADITQQKAQNGSTWFNGWKEWIDYKEKSKADDKTCILHVSIFCLVWVLVAILLTNIDMPEEISKILELMLLFSAIIFVPAMSMLLLGFAKIYKKIFKK